MEHSVVHNGQSPYVGEREWTHFELLPSVYELNRVQLTLPCANSSGFQMRNLFGIQGISIVPQV